MHPNTKFLPMFQMVGTTKEFALGLMVGILSSTSNPNYNREIKIGVILERPDLDSAVMRDIQEQINDIYKPDIRIQLLIRRLGEVNPYMAVQHACQMMYNEVGIFISSKITTIIQTNELTTSFK